LLGPLRGQRFARSRRYGSRVIVRPCERQPESFRSPRWRAFFFARRFTSRRPSSYR
jgi:hypothetical protein